MADVAGNSEAVDLTNLKSRWNVDEVLVRYVQRCQRTPCLAMEMLSGRWRRRRVPKRLASRSEAVQVQSWQRDMDFKVHHTLKNLLPGFYPRLH